MKLYDAATVLRSKNSGPFEITLDVLFSDPDIYYKLKQQELINKELVSRLYHIPEDRITHIVFYDQALGFKITFSRTVSSGTFLDRDVYGAQQHAPLMELEVEL
ncbi:DUF4387 domain-containing protein [Paenibacillus sp. SYP-B4298]|uniref:DUF4387 domain-containing protein n=1 Tax=Paenibacillus sp. SYP-B4298 TaxID=2996034 RepID=UPI0022DE778C|nr:DUF4387 domain-containing protein [Paenibacillus sp. SYP-B4298]